MFAGYNFKTRATLAPEGFEAFRTTENTDLISVFAESVLGCLLIKKCQPKLSKVSTGSVNLC